MSARQRPSVRIRLRAVAAAWLILQLAAIGAAPILLHRAAYASAVAAASDEDCCPGLAPGQVCPMHHSKAGVRHCGMRSACGSDTAALIAIAGLLSVPRTATAAAIPDLTQPVAPHVASPVLRAYAPDSPPPRA